MGDGEMLCGWREGHNGDIHTKRYRCAANIQNRNVWQASGTLATVQPEKIGSSSSHPADQQSL